MACDAEVLRDVPLFALLDDDERAVLASQVDVTKFAPRQRIYKIGDPGGRAYVMVSGAVKVSTIDEDHQEVVVDEPSAASAARGRSSSRSGPSWSSIRARTSCSGARRGIRTRSSC